MGPIDGDYDREQGPRSREAAIGQLAERQYGVVSARQLVDLGLSRAAIDARVKARRLYVLHRGVYAVGHLGLTPRSRYLAAVYACGPDALLSHRTASVLWGLLGSSSSIEVIAPRGRKPREGIVVHRSRLIHPQDRATVDGIPITSVARTIVDSADVLSERRLAGVVNEAEVLRLFDLTSVRSTLERLPGRRGEHRLRRVLAAYSDEPRFTQSEFERRFLRLCRKRRLPAPQVNRLIAGETVDIYWPDARLVIETDGETFHRTRRAFHEDRRRDRRLGALGIQVNRVTWRDLEDEASLATELTAILAIRSRDGRAA